MEILREIDDEEVNYIIEQCSENLPYAIRCYYFLMNMVEWRRKIIEENLTDISQKCLPTFYTHRFGRKGNCTVLAITGDEVKIKVIINRKQYFFNIYSRTTQYFLLLLM